MSHPKQLPMIALAVGVMLLGLIDIVQVGHPLLFAPGLLVPSSVMLATPGNDLLLILLSLSILLGTLPDRARPLAAGLAITILLSACLQCWQLLAPDYATLRAGASQALEANNPWPADHPAFTAAWALMMGSILLLFGERIARLRGSMVAGAMVNGMLLCGLVSIGVNLLDIGHIYCLVGADRLFMSTGAGIGIALAAVALKYAGEKAPWRQRDPSRGEGKRILETGTLLVLAVGLAVSIAALSAFVNRSKTETVNRLSTTLRLQSELIDTVLNESIAQASMLSRNSATVRHLEELASGKAGADTIARLRRDGESYQLRGFLSIRYYGADGSLLLATGTQTVHSLRTIDLRATVPAQLLWDEGFVLKTRIPVQDDHGNRIGWVEAEKQLLKLTLASTDRTTTSPTFDFLVCGHLDSGDVGCFPTLLTGDVLLLKPLKMRSKLPIDFALEGQSGVRTATDYRGSAVVVTHAPIGAHNLSAITKIDTQEFYAPTRALTENLIYVVGGLLLLGAAILHGRIRPLVNLLTLANQTAREATRTALGREVRIRAVVDNVNDGIVTMGRNGIMRTMNRAGAAMFGMRPEELVGRHFTTLTLPAYQEAAEALFARYQKLPPNAPERRQALLSKGAHADGHIVYFEVGTNSVEIDGEEIFIGILRDVTAAQNATRALQKSEQTLRTITDNVPALIAYVDRDERYRFVNCLYETWFCRSRDDILGLTALELFGEQAYREIEPRIRQVLAGESVSFEATALAPGNAGHARVTYLPEKNSAGQVQGYFVLVIDTTAQHDAEAALEKEHELLDAVLDTIDVGVVACDQNGTLSLFNRASREFHGLPETPLPPEQWGAYYRLYHADGITPMQKEAIPLFQALNGGPVKNVPMAIRHTDGEIRQISSTGRMMYNKAGQPLGAVVALNDVTELRAFEARLKELARFDVLTGLPNRMHFGERLSEAMARSVRNRQDMAVLYLDIDRFKSINDSFGHHAGDLVLRQFGERLKAIVRKTDTVARLGGDEFVIILEGLHRPDEEATMIAQKIVAAMGPAFDIESQRLQVAASIGLALRREDETDPQALLRRADKALYEAKSAGRNQFKAA